MNIQGKAKTLDKDDVRRKLEEAVAQVNRGEILGSHARIESGGVSMSIKEARRFLGIPDAPIAFAER